MSDPQQNEVARSVSCYDVIIVGGSVAGCATALSILSSQPKVSILVLDDCDPGAFKLGESLPAVAKQVLAGLCPRVLERISDDEDAVLVKCTGNGFCWDSPSLEETHAITNPFGMGWHLDRAAFDQILRESMIDVSQNKISLVKRSFEDVDVAEGGDRWLVLTNGDPGTMIYGCRWLIDASGRRAAVARKLGAKTVKEDSLLAFYAVLVRPSITDDGDHRTLIEACESGWWYSSPLPRGRRVVAYHTDDTDPTVQEVRQLDGFVNFLHYSTTHISRIVRESDYDMDMDVQSTTRYPVCTSACSTRTVPLSGIVAGPGPRWCAVGDAAMAFDPLSSQGMITALKAGGAVGRIVARDLVAASDDDVVAAVPKLYSQVWTKYTKEKRYMYSKGRFDGDFWTSKR